MAKVPFRVDSRPFRKQNKRLAIVMLKIAVTFFTGYYISRAFAVQFFPKIVETVKTKTDNNWIFVMGTEVNTTIFFCIKIHV